MRSQTLTIATLAGFVAFTLLAVPPAAAHIQQCEEWGGGFQEACETGWALGLDEVTSDDVATYLVMAFWLFFVVPFIIFVLYLIWLLLPKRLIVVDSKEKIAEVDAGEEKTYSIVVENRLRSRPVDVEFQLGNPPTGWNASLKLANPHPSGFTELVGNGQRHPRIQLAARKSGHHLVEAQVTVKAAADASPDEWSELELLAIPYRKGGPAPKKAKEVQLITLIREMEAELAIQDVAHTPVDFQPGDLVTTTVRVANRGSEPSEDRSVRLFLNDQEVATEPLVLQPGESGQVSLQWTAVEGENRVRVTLHRRPERKQ